MLNNGPNSVSPQALAPTGPVCEDSRVDSLRTHGDNRGLAEQVSEIYSFILTHVGSVCVNSEVIMT
jgi:hypothetical protein